MNREERALEIFKEGYNCSQAVFLAFAEGAETDGEMIKRIASAFGAGYGKSGETCGALSGALMALGFASEVTMPGHSEEKAKEYEQARQLVKSFSEENGAIRCSELLGYEPGSLESFDMAKADKKNADTCANCVKSAARILDSILKRP